MIVRPPLDYKIPLVEESKLNINEIEEECEFNRIMREKEQQREYKFSEDHPKDLR